MLMWEKGAGMQHRPVIAIGLVALGIGTAAVALLGPLGWGIIAWRITDEMENQLIGQDIVGLALIAPVAIAAGAAWWRGSRLAAPLALGPCLYGVYTWIVAILTPEYERYPGNSEAVFPLFLAMLGASWVIAAVAWSALDPRAVPSLARRERRLLAAPLLAVGLLVGLAWLRQIADVMGGDTAPEEYIAHPTAFWVIRTLDLGFVVPLALATGIGLLRNRPLAARAAYAVLPFLTLMSASVAAMGIAMLVRDDPAASVAFPAVLTPAALCLGLLSVRLLWVFAALPAPDAGPRRVTGTRTRTASV